MSLLVTLALALAPPVIPGGDARPNDVVEALRRADPDNYLQAIRGELTRPDARFGRARLVRLGARTLGDALRLVPGVDLTRDVRGRLQIASRGLRGERRAHLFIDGVRSDDAWDESAEMDLPLDLIESLEVRHGPVAGHPGATLIVEVTTTPRRGGEVRAYGGTQLSAGAGGRFGAALGTWQLAGSAGVQTTDGPRPVVEADAFTDQGFPRALPLRTELARVDAAVAASGPLAGGRLSASTRVGAERRGPWLGTFDTIDETGIDQGLSLSGGVFWSLLIARPLELRVGATLQHRARGREGQVTPSAFNLADRDGDGEDEVYPDGVRFTERYGATRAGLEAGGTLALGQGHELDGQVRFGADLLQGYALAMNRDLVGVPQPLGPVASLDAKEQVVRVRGIGVLSDRWRTDSLSLTSSLTLDAANEPMDLLDAVGGAITADWRVSPNISFGAQAARGLVLPTLEERFSQVALVHTDISTGGYLGDPDVRPELLHTSSAWAQWTGQGIGARVTAFGSWTQRAIELVDDNGNVELTTNRGDAVIGGLEASGRARFSGATLFGNVAWFRGGFVRDDQLTLITNLAQLRADLGWELPVIVGSLSAWAELGSERRNNARSDLERLRVFRIPGYALLNLGFESEPVFGGARLFAQVHNLLDQTRSDDAPRPDRVLGLVPRSGVTVYAGISLGN